MKTGCIVTVGELLGFQAESAIFHIRLASFTRQPPIKGIASVKPAKFLFTKSDIFLQFLTI